jgi:hypothetical protein
MEWIQKILVAASGSAILALLTIYLSQRRLCAVARYFPYSELAQRGVTVAFTVLNRGHRTEANIRLQLNPTLQYFLLARSTADIKLVGGNILTIDRLPKWHDEAAIVSVEGGDFTNKSVLNFSSTDAKGRMYDGLDKVPALPGAVAIGLLVAVALFGFVGYMGYNIALDYLKTEARAEVAAHLGDASAKSDPKLEAKQKALDNLGWQPTAEFVASDLGAAYDLGEFPVAIQYRFRRGDLVVFKVDLWNKTDSWLTVSVSVGEALPSVQAAESHAKSRLGDTLLPANSRRAIELSAYLPRNEAQALPVQVFLTDSKGKLYLMRSILSLQNK